MHLPFRFRPLGIALMPLLIGLLFFAASLSPSLIPRDWITQGLLAGIALALGHLIGQMALTFWRALALPEAPPGSRLSLMLHMGLGLPVAVAVAGALAMDATWQNSVRLRVGMARVDDTHTLRMTLVALAIFATLYVIGWAIQGLFDALRRRLTRKLPVPTANALGLLMAVLVVWLITSEGIVRTAFDIADEAYASAQHLFDPADAPPTDPTQAGGPNSRVDWGAMGAPGRDFIRSGPTGAEIAAFTGRPARDPIRVYVGRAQAEDPQTRAGIALEELKRLKAFDRKVLIVASPTGTGWMDPAGHDPVEYLHNGDTATVAVQYSYLQSPLALIFQTRSGLDQATATFHAVHSYWKTLPPDTRPRLYLHGMSLGAWSSMFSADVFTLLNAPIDGALWAGPPFPSNLWNRAIARRDDDSPYVLPKLGDGALIRFASQYRAPSALDWGPTRIVFLQYASDPIVFFESSAFWREPTWMREAPAPDVSPRLDFMPVVTQLQLALDMALSKQLPHGFGHNYVARDYIDGWVAVSAPKVSAAEVDRLKRWCALEWGLGCRNGRSAPLTGADALWHPLPPEHLTGQPPKPMRHAAGM